MSHERYIPYIIETSAGLTRTVLVVLSDAYDEEVVEGEKRVVLRFHPRLAPITVGVFPLVKKDGLAELARKLDDELCEDFRTFYDEGGAIGRRYRRQDEVGTPFCVTLDYQTKEDQTVTIRFRDSMEQVRVKMADIAATLKKAIKDYGGSGSERRNARGTAPVRVRHPEGARLRQPVLQRGGPAEAAGHRAGDLLHRLRPHGGEPAHRPPPAAHVHGAPAARGPPAHRARGRGHDPDRRPHGQARRCGRSCPWRPSPPTRRLFREQIARFLDFCEGKALMLDNAEWLAPLNYIEFLRDIGRHFSVNRMLTFETYKMRMETGLSFIEFNYQILQSYDYLVLFRTHGCRLQMGGDDQWGNIVAGMDLIRRVEGVEAFALTSPADHAVRRQEDGQVARAAPCTSRPTS